MEFLRITVPNFQVLGFISSETDWQKKFSALKGNLKTILSQDVVHLHYKSSPDAAKTEEFQNISLVTRPDVEPGVLHCRLAGARATRPGCNAAPRMG